MDKEKLENAINQLITHRNDVDNLDYEHYSPEGLKLELEKIQDSIDYLESLLYKSGNGK